MPDENTLDPDDWDEISGSSERPIEGCLSHMRDVRERPVWQPTPESIKARFREPLPRDGQPIEKLLAFFRRNCPALWHGQSAPEVLGLGAWQRQRGGRSAKCWPAS